MSDGSGNDSEGHGLDGHDNEGFAVAVRYPTERLARQAVESLTIHGIGALNDVLESPTPDEARFVVLVVPDDLDRAREVLGVEAPPVPDAPVASRGWSNMTVLLIFAAAMILVPLVAFYVSYKLFGG